jgi:curli biogenesis system outer membrane secretion channel CsgG
LNRAVAIKLPSPQRLASQEHREAFLREARKVAQLRHPGIVPVHDIGQDGPYYFIVWELIEGGSLADRMRCGRIPLNESVRIVAEVAEALHYAHQRDVVHRDVKPGNILLDARGKAVVADFGVAATEDELLKEDGIICGTLAYVSPEQVRGQSRRITARTDVYSLGVVLYELLTGRLPFKAKTYEDLRQSIISGEPRPPRTIDDSIPPEIEAVCLKSLAREPGDRYSTAADLARQLRTSPSRQSRNRLVAVAITFFLACGAIVGLTQVLKTNRDGRTGQQVNLEKPSGQGIPSAVEAVESQPRLAVLYFENHSPERKDLLALPKGLCLMLTSKLKATQKYDLVERVEIEKVFRELHLSQSPAFDRNTVAHLGKLLGARYLLLGSFFETLGQFRMDARIVEVETGRVVATSGVDGRAEQFGILIDRLTEQLLDNNEPQHDASAAGVRDNDASTIARMGDAVEAYDAGDLDKARSILEPLCRERPLLTPARMLYECTKR